MTTTKVTYSYFLEKKPLKRQYLRNKKWKKFQKLFFWTTLNKECIGLCRKTKIQEIISGNIHVKVSLREFMWMWKQKVNMIRLSIWKIDGFSPRKYIYLKSAPQELPSDRSQDGQRWLQVTYCCFLEKKSLKRQYLTGTETEKTSKKVFYNVHLIRNLLVYVAKRKSEKEFLVIFMQKWV